VDEQRLFAIDEFDRPKRKGVGGDVSQYRTINSVGSCWYRSSAVNGTSKTSYGLSLNDLSNRSISLAASAFAGSTGAGVGTAAGVVVVEEEEDDGKVEETAGAGGVADAAGEINVSTLGVGVVVTGFGWTTNVVRTGPVGAAAAGYGGAFGVFTDRAGCTGAAGGGGGGDG